MPSTPTTQASHATERKPRRAMIDLAEILPGVDPPSQFAQLDATLAEASARLEAGMDRAVTLKRQRDELTTRIRDASTDRDAAKLRREREQITSDLVHLPDDVTALAEAYCDALIAWAGCLYPWAARVREQAKAEWDAPFSAFHRAKQKLDPSLPAHRCGTPAEQGEARARVTELYKPLPAIRQRFEGAESVMTQIRIRLRGRFGDQVQGGIVNDHARALWVEGIRRRVQAQVQPAITVGLRPLSQAPPALV